MASVKETSRQVRQLQGRWWSSRGVYIIPTYHGTPEPYMDQKFFKQRFGYSKVPSWDAEDDIWSITNSTFHALGIRKILLGGMNLNDNVLKPDDKSENALKEVIACVNQTWKHLQGYDEVEIASFAYPLNRKDIQKE